MRRIVQLNLIVLVALAAVSGAAVTGITHRTVAPTATAAPVFSVRSVFVPIAPAGSGVNVALPATAAIVACVEATSASVGGAFGCNLIVTVNESDPTVTRTFRAQAARTHPNNTSVYDGAVEHPVGGWYQRTLTGIVTPYVVLEAN